MTDSASSEDVMAWPDGTWCYRFELWEMTHMSDDFEVIPFDEIAADGDGVPFSSPAPTGVSASALTANKAALRHPESKAERITP